MIPDTTLYSVISNKYNTFTPEEEALFTLWEKKVPDTYLKKCILSWTSKSLIELI